jgi:hypothetical protein
MINEDLRRWFKEKWVDISKKKKGGGHPPCGRSEAKDSSYPKCRPSVRVSSKTPETSGEMSREEKKKAVRQKRSAESKVSTTTQGRKPVMTSHKNINESLVEKITNFAKPNEEQQNSKYQYSFDKVVLEGLDSSFLNKKVIVQYLNETNDITHNRGLFKIASNNFIKNGKDFEILNENETIAVSYDDILSIKFVENGNITEYSVLNEGENKPTNPSLWSKAKSLAKQKFKVYPSAYANGWAAKWYKKHGGGWKSVNESVQLNEQVTKKPIMEKVKPSITRLLTRLGVVSEEIVNAKHAGTMTKREIKSRDRIAKKVKAKPIKGKDTAENAKYRLATYIELRKRGQEPKGKKKKGKK